MYNFENVLIYIGIWKYVFILEVLWVSLLDYIIMFYVGIYVLENDDFSDVFF